MYIYVFIILLFYYFIILLFYYFIKRLFEGNNLKNRIDLNY